MAILVVTPSNIGNSIKANAAGGAANKLDVNVDGTTLLITATTGIVKANLAHASYDAMVKSFETTTTLVNAGGGVYTYTNEDGVVTNITIPADKFLANASWNATTGVLTLTLSDATTVPVTLGDLISVSKGNSTSISIAGDGRSGTPLVASIIVSPTAGNILTSTANGVYVPTGLTLAQVIAAATVDVQDAFGTHIYYAFP